MGGKFNQNLIQVDKGPKGDIGPTGPVTNMLVIEGAVVFGVNSPFYTVTYTFTTVKGSIWETTGSFVFTDDTAFMQITLTNFLLTTTKKFNVTIEKTDLRHNGGAAIPDGMAHALGMEVLEKSNDKIRFGIMGKASLSDWPQGNSAQVKNVGNGFNIESMKFTLLIIAED